MAGKKVQVPVLGGLRKVIQVPTSQNVGTTIQEFGSQVVSLAQLKAALGITNTKTTTTGGGGSLGTTSLIVGPGMSGGGVLTGAVNIGLLQPISPVVWQDALLPDDWVGSGGSGGGSGGGGLSTVATANSVTGNGTTGSPAQLVGDSASPGASMLYGTNGSGTKGWYAQPGGGASGQWTNIVTQSFASSTTGWASNGSGTWGIVSGVLNQSANNTNGPCFIYQTQIPFALCRIQVDVMLVSAGSGSTQATGFCLSNSASPGTTPTNNIVDECMRYVSGTPNYSSDYFGSSTIASFAYNWGARDVYHHLELIINGLVRIAYIDGVAVGSWVANGSYAQFQYFGLFAYGGAANFKNFTLDTLTP
jgi:hypothetical protein